MDGDMLYSIGELARRTGLRSRRSGSSPIAASCRLRAVPQPVTAATVLLIAVEPAG
jgi:hypothetical protein